MPGQNHNWAPGSIQASFGRSAKLYDRAAKRGDVVAVPFGRYLLLERIKRGGMAEVYRAKVVGTEGFEKIVAIKRILPHLAANDDFVTMFIDEAKIVSLLNHQNICPVIELGRCDDGLYIVMEYIWGRDLRQILNALSRAGRLMPLSIAAYIAGRIAEGLDYAHRRSGPRGEALSIVHRDISPQNVLASYEGDVKIIDFGIARASQRSTQTRVGTFKGKFAYMSPEQARGQALDRRSDIFAVGILLHEMITGSRLFAAKNDLDTLDRVRNCQVPYPTRPFEEVPSELIAIAMKALQAEPERRWQWAGEMQLALDRFLMRSGELATASRLGTWICLNFAEHAAKALVDQERATRAQPPGAAPQHDASAQSNPPPLVSRHPNMAQEEYIPLQHGEGSRTDQGSVSYSTTGLPEVSASVMTNGDSSRLQHAQPQHEPEADVEFEVDDDLFQGNDGRGLFDEVQGGSPEGAQPVDANQFHKEGPANQSWSGGSVVIIDENERSQPDIRDSAAPNPRPSYSPDSHHDWSQRPERPTIPQRAQKAQKGIEVSTKMDGEGEDEDLVILDDAPPPKSSSGRK